jgi:hypothetical protein
VSTMERNLRHSAHPHRISSRHHGGFFVPPLPWQTSSTFATCVEKLAAFRASLTNTHRLTPQVITDRHDAPIFGSLVMLYLWWNMCHLELYRVVMPGHPESISPSTLAFAPSDWARRTRNAAVEHAKAMTSLLELIVRHVPDKNLTICDPDLAKLVHVAFEVQLDSIATGPDPCFHHPRQQFVEVLTLMQRGSKLFETVRLSVSTGIFAMSRQVSSSRARIVCWPDTGCTFRVCRLNHRMSHQRSSQIGT